MTVDAFIVTEPSTWLARGRSPVEAAALAEAWRTFPDLPADTPLADRMARTRARIEVLRPISDATTARTEHERQERNFAFVADKLARRVGDERDRAILRGRDSHGFDWNAAVRYAEGWYAAHAGWKYRPPAVRLGGSMAEAEAYETGFRDGGGEPADLFDTARRAFLAADQAKVAGGSPPPQRARPLPSAWPKPTDEGRPVAWPRRLAILPDYPLGAGTPGNGADPLSQVVARSAGAMVIVLLSARHGFVAPGAITTDGSPLTQAQADRLIADPSQGTRLQALLYGREIEDVLVALQDEALRVLDHFAAVLPICRHMARTRNTPLQQRQHLRTWLDRGCEPGGNRGAGHIRWGKVAKGLTGKLGEFTARYGGKRVGGHVVVVETGDRPATGYVAADGHLLAAETLFTNKARLREEIAAALRRFGGATRLGDARDRAGAQRL